MTKVIEDGRFVFPEMDMSKLTPLYDPVDTYIYKVRYSNGNMFTEPLKHPITGITAYGYNDTGKQTKKHIYVNDNDKYVYKDGYLWFSKPGGLATHAKVYRGNHEGVIRYTDLGTGVKAYSVVDVKEVDGEMNSIVYCKCYSNDAKEDKYQIREYTHEGVHEGRYTAKWLSNALFGTVKFFKWKGEDFILTRSRHETPHALFGVVSEEDKHITLVHLASNTTRRVDDIISDKGKHATLAYVDNLGDQREFITYRNHGCILIASISGILDSILQDTELQEHNGELAIPEVIYTTRFDEDECSNVTVVDISNEAIYFTVEKKTTRFFIMEFKQATLYKYTVSSGRKSARK